MKQVIFAISFAVLIVFASPAYCDGFSNGQGLNLNIQQSEPKPIFIIDKSDDSPTTKLYIGEIEKRIQLRIATRKLPLDSSDKKIYGVFTVRITLQSDGHVDDVQILPTPESVVIGNYNTFSESVAHTVKGEDPFPQFPLGSFSGYELIAFETNVEITNVNEMPKASKKSRRHGAQ